MSERPTFSPFWHRVRALKPRLRPHVQITRQHYRGRRWHVVQDPSSNQFYRLTPIGHEFVGLLDGRRTVEESWTIVLEKHGDDAPTQQEAIQLIAQLYGANLLSVDATPEVEQLLRRGRERRKKKAMTQALGIMSFRIKLFNPDALVAWVEPIVRPVLNRFGFIAWLAFLLFVGFRLAPEADRLGGQFEGALSPGNWGWMIVVFVVTKAIHEMGHAVILKRFGGQVPEFGIMLLVLFPAPYVDATSAWALENKWKRISVGAGGMLFELFTAGVAALVWLSVPGDSLTSQIAYNAMLIASISTVLFNANPLMRFDGYYILSDLLEIPNLMSRSQDLLKHLFKRYPFGLKDSDPPTTNRTEWWILLVYGIGALAYRVFLFLSITLYVMGKLFAIGLLLAIWTAVMWFVVPIGKFVNWLAGSPQLADKRVRTISATLAMVAGAVVVIGAIPVDDNRRASGVVESIRDTGVFAGTDGFVKTAHVRAGDRVLAGEPIVTLEAPRLDAEIDSARADLARRESVLRQVMQEQPAAEDIHVRRVEVARAQLDRLLDRQGRLVLRAPWDGVVVGQDPHDLVGRLVREGEGITQVVNAEQLRVVATLGQRENSWAVPLTRGAIDGKVQMRLVSQASRVIDARIDRLIEAGQVQLDHPSLTYAGGGDIQIDPTDQSGTLARTRQFVMFIEPTIAPGSWIGAPGERVRLRFTLEPKPLLAQWADRLHKMVQGKIDL